jgi:predicted GIY-YIG superfamily endonuclease
MKKWWLYVLKLERGKYYVGITSKTPERRFYEHKTKYAVLHGQKSTSLSRSLTLNILVLSVKKGRKFMRTKLFDHIKNMG